mmetsp:Transcript_42427/g.100690  ORF Transcript_42427/g.100690 Transcript_42427/m.100690 type:complete len:329 (+) Transcript_42427:170-1156(+)
MPMPVRSHTANKVREPVSFVQARCRSGCSARKRSVSVFCSAEKDRGASRAVVILPGLGNSSGDYTALSTLLTDRGLHVETASVARIDWMRNAAGLRYRAYWTGNLKPRPTVDWYLNRVEAAMDSAKRAVDGGPVTLLGHSAGGWLGRLFLLEFGTAGVDRFVSLGSPHNPPPKGAPGVIDQTRGILTWMEDSCPGAFHDDVEYTSVAGKFLKGATFTGSGGDGAVTFNQRVVGAGYQQVCGSAEVWGDGVVPVPAALLEGSAQVVLDGVYHSPLGAVEPKEPAPPGAQPAARPWYGSVGVIDQWLGSVTGERAMEPDNASALDTTRLP